MIDKLIKLANDMDAKGLTAEADRLDAIISKMAEERKMSKEELIMFLFGPEATDVRDEAGLVIIEPHGLFSQAASQCMLSDQCTYMNSLKEIHITDNEGNKYKFKEETPMDPASRIIMEMILLD
jgi:hypothetical protein